jgi:hypothetical protein
MSLMKIAATASVLALTALAPLAAGQHKPSDVPVSFSANVEAVGALGAIATSVKIHIDSYTTERDRKVLLTALRTNGYQTFLPAFRRAPIVGYVQIKEQKWNLRWAQQEETERGQTVTAATDQPIYFIGGGNPDAKPRTGYEMAVIRLDVDTLGMGTGTMAAAARVKPNADATWVTVDDYSSEPMKLTSVTRIF